MTLDTLETCYGSAVARLGLDGQEAVIALIPRQAGGWAHLSVPTPTTVAPVPLAPYANHGRWVVECPDCHGAQEASRNDRRFFCTDCANESVGGAWRAVIWPQDAVAIEAALLARPAKAHRNWRAPETVADLLAENADHGVAP